jgi:hypothetical protein
LVGGVAEKTWTAKLAKTSGLKDDGLQVAQDLVSEPYVGRNIIGVNARLGVTTGLVVFASLGAAMAVSSLSLNGLVRLLSFAPASSSMSRGLF